MTRPRQALLGAILTLVLLVGAMPGRATPAAPSGGAAALDGFLRRAAPLCRNRAATACIDAAWSFADSDGDRLLSLTEVRAVRAALAAWAMWKGAALPEAERAGMALALWMVDSVGLAKLMRAYDADGDDRLSRAEALADLRLDGRPLGILLGDHKAVDHAALRRRLSDLLPQPLPTGR
ncbi:MAG: hypothetical protein ACTSRY_02665 [Alphaproteobacteria bacterium]